MKHKPGERVLLHTHSGQVRASVIAADRDSVTIRLWDGRTIVLDTHDDVARLSKDRHRRR